MRFHHLIPVMLLLLIVAPAAADNRMNVMECSDEEVAAYVSRPNPARMALSDYHSFERAHKQREVKLAEKDPSVCFGLLYGDLSALGDQIKDLGGLFSGFKMPDLGMLLDRAMDKLSESICTRAKSVGSNIQKEIDKNIAKFKSDAMRELDRRYGEKALNRYATDAVIPPDYQRQGLRFRNNALTTDDFKKNLRDQWRDHLDELRDDAKDNIKGKG